MEVNFKSKRNSKYKYGRRRSRSLNGIISTELCKTIDNYLPPEERLKLLIKNCLENATLIAGREFGISVRSEEVDENLTKCLTNLDSELKKKDVYKTAIYAEESLMEERLISNLAKYNEEVAKLDKEILTWDKLLADEKIALDDAKNEVPTSFKETLDFREYEKLDYRKLADDISLMVEDNNHQIDKISSSCTKLLKHAELTDKVVAHLSKEIKYNLSKRIEHTPKTLIKMFKKSN